MKTARSSFQPRNRLRACALVCGLATSAVTVAGVPPGNHGHPIIKYLERIRSETAAPSISIAVAQHGEIVFSNAVGFADLERSEEASNGTIYRTGSIAKVITAVAVMQLIEEGKLNIDAKLDKLVPAFPKKKWDITIEHLLTHTSGVRHYSVWDQFPGGRLSKDYASATDALAIFVNDRLLFEPGSKFQYSTYGFTLLQVAVETAADSDFETLLKEKIWRPADMPNTSLERKDSSFAVGYSRPNKFTSSTLGSENRKGYFRPEPPHRVSYKHAGGGMLSTPEDLVKFAQALLDETLLSERYKNMMYRKPYSDLEGGDNVALGWRVEERDGRSIIHMGGSISGFKSYLVTWPEEALSIAVMTNQSDFSRRDEIAFHLAEFYFDNPK